MPIEPVKVYEPEVAERAVGKAVLMSEFLLQAALADNNLFQELYDELEAMSEQLGNYLGTKDKMNTILRKIGDRIEAPAVSSDD
jgi:hypothetical protein